VAPGPVEGEPICSQGAGLAQTLASGSDRSFDSGDNVEGDDKFTTQAFVDKTSRGPSPNLYSSSTSYTSEVPLPKLADIGVELGALMT
jgi:hypothetical protein